MRREAGRDWKAASGPVASFGPSNIKNEQLRLTYKSGPLAFGISVEDADDTDRSDIPAVQSYAMYSSDAFTGQIVGLYQNDDVGDDTDWAVGGGATVGVSDAFQVTAAGVVGQGTSAYANNLAPFTLDEDFWAASAGILADLSEDTRLELGVGYEDYDVAGKALGFGGGVYWDPVSQVTLGVGTTYLDYEDVVKNGIGNDDSLQVFFGTWLRFP